METEEQKAVNLALKSLSYSPKTSYQLAFHLKKKGFSDPIIENAISQLNSWAYIDNEYWINTYINQHKKRHHGPNYIFKKLLERHTPSTVASKALQESYTNEEERYWIRSFLDTKSPTINSHNDKSLILKKLLQRGFRYEPILSELSTIPIAYPEF